jgi:hypothetical protein
VPLLTLPAVVVVRYQSAKHGLRPAFFCRLVLRPGTRLHRAGQDVTPRCSTLGEAPGLALVLDDHLIELILEKHADGLCLGGGEGAVEVEVEVRREDGLHTHPALAQVNSKVSGPESPENNGS